MKLSTFPLHQWLRSVPIKDPVERRMASLVQAILLGSMAIVFIAAIINLLIAPEMPRHSILICSLIIILVIWLPLMLLRRGYFHSWVLIIILGPILPKRFLAFPARRVTNS